MTGASQGLSIFGINGRKSWGFIDRSLHLLDEKATGSFGEDWSQVKESSAWR